MQFVFVALGRGIAGTCECHLCHPNLGASGSLQGIALTSVNCITCEISRIPILQIFEERNVRFVKNNISCEVCPNKCSLWCAAWFPIVRGDISDTQRMHFGAGLVSLGPQQELIEP